MAQELPDELLLAHVGQKVLVMKDGKVLMCRGTQGFLANLWDFPGGRMHTGEEPMPALKRELLEEFGVLFQIGKPLLTMVTYETPSNIPRYYVVFEAKLEDTGAQFKVAEDEIAEVRWIGKEDVADLPTWEAWRTLLTEYFAQHA